MKLSESTNKTGMYELFQDLTKTNPKSYSLYKFARDANNALGNFNLKALMASQKMEHDDLNQTDYPIITLNIISGQQDYPLDKDNSSVPNQILDILRVECANPSGVFNFLSPYDQTEEGGKSITELAKISGTPHRYDKAFNALWLDSKPDYNYANGLVVYFGRTPVYFIGDGAHNDIEPGIPQPFHEYIVYLPAYLYCVTNFPKLAAGYLTQVQRIEADIARFYLWRNKDDKKGMKPRVENCR